MRLVGRGSVVPIPDLQALIADDGNPYQVAIVIAIIAGVLGVTAVIGGLWRRFGNASDLVAGASIWIGVVAWVTLGGAVVAANVVEDRLPGEGARRIGTYLWAKAQVVGELEEFYGISFYKPPDIPQRGEDPRPALVQGSDRVDRCWVHTVDAENRLAVSCSDTSFEAATELPAASGAMSEARQP